MTLVLLCETTEAMKSLLSVLALSALLTLPLGAADGKKHILALGAAEGWFEYGRVWHRYGVGCCFIMASRLAIRSRISRRSMIISTVP